MLELSNFIIRVKSAGISVLMRGSDSERNVHQSVKIWREMAVFHIGHEAVSCGRMANIGRQRLRRGQHVMNTARPSFVATHRWSAISATLLLLTTTFNVYNHRLRTS
uniref:Transmembrane protein n=1 Tax=Ascaris lumbricoides TaxID=6252 RepID=A0A0M3IH70_ASCLU